MNELGEKEETWLWWLGFCVFCGVVICFAGSLVRDFLDLRKCQREEGED